MAREHFLLSTWDESQGTIEFKFKDAPELGTVQFATADLPDSIKVCGMLHGFEQKLRDKVAGELKKLGKSAFADFFRGTVADHTAQFQTDEWNAKGEGEGTPRIGLLIRAIARVRSEKLGREVTAEAAKVWYNAQTDAIKAGIAKAPPIVAAKEAIKAEDAAKKPAVAVSADVLAALDAA